MEDEEELIFFGDEVKALEGGKFGGYLIRYAVDTHDLTGDIFTKDSVVEIPRENLPIYYNHGKDHAIKKRVIGRAAIRQDEVGYWLEGQIALHDEYEKAVTELIKAGKLGLSSGALSHLVEREPVTKDVFLLKSWVVGEASLTPTPAEPFNQAVSLKSLPDVSALPAAEDDKPNDAHKEIKMSENTDIKALVAEALAESKAAEVKAAEAKAAHDAEIKAAKDEAVKAAVEELKRKGALKVSYHSTEKKNDSDEGVQAFKSWLKTGQVNHELIDPSDVTFTDDMGNVKTAYNVNTNASGAAYLVPDPLYNQIVAKRDLASWVRQAPTQKFSTTADHILVPRESTSNTAFVLTAEAAAYDEDEATFTQKDLILYKYTKLIKMSEEFINYDGTNFDAWLTQSLARKVAVTENSIYTTGSGASEPEGIYTNSTAGNTVTTSVKIEPQDLTALVGQLGAGYNVASECGFVMKNATKWYIKGIGTSTFFSFIETPSLGPVGTPGASAGIGEPGFLGYPVFISDDMGAYTSQTAYSVIFGNWNFYGIVEKPGILIQRNPYLYMANGQIGIFATIYRGGGILQTEALYHLVPK